MSELNLQGNNLISNLDKNCKRGFGIYLKNSIGYPEIDTCDFEAEVFVRIEVKLRDNDKLLIGCDYRSGHQKVGEHRNAVHRKFLISQQEIFLKT